MADDYVALHQLVDRYADAVNRRDADAWGACWAQDGTWDLGAGRQVTGRDAIVGLWKQLMGGLPFVVQIVHSGVVDSAGDTATARWYLTEYMHLPDGAKRMGVGVYRDDCVRVDGRWQFARRRYNLLYSGPADLSGTTFPFPAD
ncbi:MAG: nuclear transport factor 2 family protein [Dehalococcoidia bacterium]|nr:nuclear transport factor 2 family protein [Dehalococcoidia bacterium]